MERKPIVEHDIRNAEGIIIEELTETQVDLKSLGSTYRTAKITMITDDIEIFRNHSGQDTPFLILARATMDSNEYAALFDTKTKQGHIVGITRVNGMIKEIRDLDGLFSDEEWAVINEFFQQNKVFESNRIFRWTFNSAENKKLDTHLPNHLLESWKLDPTTMKRKR